EILNWFVTVGEYVEEDQPIIEVQTDKAAVEITSPQAGKIIKKYGEEGNTLHVGDTIVDIQLSASETEERKEKEKGQNITETVVPSKFPNLKQHPDEKRVIAAPSVRKFARDHEIDLKDVEGSEKNGRITKQDVLNYMDQNEKSGLKEIEKPFSESVEKTIPIR